ncbi:hypothetical protein MRB53_006877 [Persea americana]|uniref:Uncharacterized protein n=1 Tax=Persea americana TaxID=3435 RepID=A0ACC2MHE0_PERAE|nr:hypothetical protein MRB53_006877 [Persea americana]|eukprot:TRINITY_DN1032_c1_g2_i1.p1 TRINITY_DN1032_c1_g2~~TRINITY_DN1032_c1_g2_i1.p1  ORF type:complete len:298 (+),score=42.01 TRINITY_DN1032_c1_g2_i1:154-1047(+)
MAPSVPTHLLLLLLLCIFAVSALRFASGSSLSPPQPPLFITALQFQCPLSVVPSAPVEVDGESLDRILSSNQKNSYTSVFFYASWCPFSRSTKATFDVLSSMFPQITHLMLEESSVMPVVFSRYGVHSLPSILMVNRTSRLRYSGSKDLSSLVHFYKRITGFEPVQYFALDHPGSLAYEKSPLVWNSSLKEILRREPYLVFSLLFLCLKVFLYFFPGILSRVIAFWVSYGSHLNLGIVGETSQLLERVLHVFNLKKVWSKLRLCKVRNFHNGAKNARVWASSLASVSLGESSSIRSA